MYIAFPLLLSESQIGERSQSHKNEDNIDGEMSGCWQVMEDKCVVGSKNTAPEGGQEHTRAIASCKLLY